MTANQAARDALFFSPYRVDIFQRRDSSSPTLSSLFFPPSFPPYVYSIFFFLTFKSFLLTPIANPLSELFIFLLSLSFSRLLSLALALSLARSPPLLHSPCSYLVRVYIFVTAVERHSCLRNVT